MQVKQTWFLQYNNGTYRCDSGDTGTLIPTTGSVTDALVGSGSSGFTFDGLFYEYGGSNIYNSYRVESLPNGGEGVIRYTFTMTSATTATGSYGAVYGDCTLFAPLTLNYIGG